MLSVSFLPLPTFMFSPVAFLRYFHIKKIIRTQSLISWNFSYFIHSFFTFFNRLKPESPHFFNIFVEFTLFQP